MKNALVLLSFLLLNQGIKAQWPINVHYNTANGLPSSQVYEIIQDSKGFIWFATDNGVSRFNGYEFKNFSVTNGLHSQVIFKLFEDPKGRIWFSNFDNKLTYFYNDSIYPYKFNHKIPSSPTNPSANVNIKSIVVDSIDNVYIEWYNYGHSMIDSNGQFTHITPENNNEFIVKKIANTDRYCGYFPEDRKYASLNFKTVIPGIINPYTITGNLYGNKTESYFLNRLNSETFLVAIGSSMHILKNSISTTVTVPGAIIRVKKDTNEDLWIGTVWRKGAYCFSKCDGYLKHYKHYLPNYTVSDILRDKEGGLWFSTLENGVFFFPNENFINIENISPSKQITKIVNTNNAIYFASSWEKVYRLSPDHKLQSLINEPISYIRRLEYKNNLLWAYTDLGLFQFDGLTKVEKRIRAYDPKQSTYSLINPRTVQPITNKTFYLAKDKGVYYCVLNNNTFDTLYKVAFSIGAFDEVVTDFSTYNNDKFLIASYVGLFLAQSNSKNPTILEVDDIGKRHPILNTRIDEIHFSKFDGRFYLATKEKGVLIWDTERDSIFQIDRSKGLTDNLVSSISIVDSVIWIGTKQGLNKLVFRNKSFSNFSITNYTKYNGLPTNEINGIAEMEGNVYMATNEGLCYFNPQKVSRNVAMPPVYISKIKVNDSDVSRSNHLNLTYNKNDISIEFIGLSYKTLGNVTYKYRLSGIDTSWHYTKNRDVRFPKLQSGTYVFSVSAQNEDGIWSSDPAEFEFTISPPFWETTLFLISLSLALALIIMLIYNLRIREIKKRNKQHRDEEYNRHKLEEELISSKQTALIQQMNPHFMFNALNSIQSLMCENNTTEARQYLSSFAKLMRITLENIQKQNISLDKEIASLKLYLEIETLRFNNLLKYEIKVDSNIDTAQCNVPTMLLQPYVENAILHGLRHKPNSMGILNIEFTLLDDQTLLCRIEDNGIGRKKSAEISAMQEAQHKSYGSKITQKRIDLINSIYKRSLDINYIDLEDRDGHPQGTIVEIKLPII